jgi:hypothetical protein
LTWQLIYLTQIKDILKINEIRKSAFMSTDGNAEPSRCKIVLKKQLFSRYTIRSVQHPTLLLGPSLTPITWLIKVKISKQKCRHATTPLAEQSVSTPKGRIYASLKHLSAREGLGVISPRFAKAKLELT